MTEDQVVTLLTATIVALSGLLGTLLGGWLTRRSASGARQQEEIAAARVVLVRVASLIVREGGGEDAQTVSQAADQAAVGAITLGYGSKTALAMLEAIKEWHRFEPASFPRRKARDELLTVLDEMIERSLPAGLRPKGHAKATELVSAVRRPD